MSLAEPPLPSATLRESWLPPFDDAGFRAAAIDETRWLVERAGLASDTRLLEVGCGPGRLAVGIRLRLGAIGHYTGIAADPAHVSWCQEHLAGSDFEFLSLVAEQPGQPAGSGEIALAVDRRYDLVYARTVPWDRPHSTDEMLRTLRHHLADTGTILIAHDPAVPDVEELTDAANRSGLVIASIEPQGADAVVELNPGLIGRGQRLFDRLAQTAWHEREIAGLEARLGALADEIHRSAEDAEARIGALASKLAARDLLVADLRVRLKRARSETRRLKTTIEVKDLELAEAHRTMSSRLARGLGLRNRPSSVERSTPTAPIVSSTDVDDDVEQVGPPREASPVAGVESVPHDGRDRIDPASVVIYTALIADHDHLADVTPYASGASSFVCFSDVVPTDARGWEILPASYFSVDPKRVALFYKTHPHIFFGDRELSVWVDASISWTRSPFDVLAGIGASDHDVVALRRDDAMSVESLADDICRLGLDSAPLVEAQIDRFRRAGFAPEGGLHDTSILVRRHLFASVVAFDEAWWAELERGSRRDRLSFDYVASSQEVSVGTLHAPSVDDPGFVKGHHRHEVRYRRPRSTPDARRRRAGWNVRRYPERWRAVGGSSRSPIDVVVPVHDALAAVQRCVRSILDDPTFYGRLILVDDGSQPPTRDWCSELARTRPEVVLLRHSAPRGFSAASNLGIASTSTEVFVVVNSDAVVPPNWTTRLAQRLHAHERVGLIGPLSNAASWQSIPAIRDDDGALAVNGLPPGCSLEDVNDYLEIMCAEIQTPFVGTLNGFCLMIRREVVNECGAFDELGFPFGYGEEVDLTLRATDAGFLCAVAPDTYVYHSKSRSFGRSRRETLKAEGQAILRERYGADRLDRVAASTRNHPALEFVRSAFAQLYVPADPVMGNLAARATI